MTANERRTNLARVKTLEYCASLLTDEAETRLRRAHAAGESPREGVLLLEAARLLFDECLLETAMWTEEGDR